MKAKDILAQKLTEQGLSPDKSNQVVDQLTKNQPLSICEDGRKKQTKEEK